MDPNRPPNKRLLLIIASAVDAVIAGILLLIYFGFLPVDISGLGIPRGVIGVIGGIWFFGALGILAYQLTKTDISE
jgi:hypothetical protein